MTSEKVRSENKKGKKNRESKKNLQKKTSAMKSIYWTLIWCGHSLSQKGKQGKFLRVPSEIWI